MTEEEIAAELKAKLDEPEAPAVPQDEKLHDSIANVQDPERARFLDYFDVPSVSRKTTEVSAWLDKVIDWARDEAGSSEYTDMLRVINDQERIMGSKIKQDRLATLYRYALINGTRKRLIQEERALYG